MAVAVPVLMEAPLAGVPVLALALAVGLSRVYLRVHYRRMWSSARCWAPGQRCWHMRL